MFDGLFNFVKTAWNNITSTVSRFVQHVISIIVKSISGWLESILDFLIIFLKNVREEVYLITNGEESVIATDSQLNQIIQTTQAIAIPGVSMEEQPSLLRDRAALLSTKSYTTPLDSTAKNAGKVNNVTTIAKSYKLTLQ
jgi:hypothetical protein